MKIAVLGSAGSSIGRAPFKNSKYEEWAEGKSPELQRAHDYVPGDWDLWGCSPGCWAVVPRATRWFELHRWENDVPWFSPAYRQFLRDFKGPVYTGGRVEEIPNHVVYPIDRMEEKFSSYFMTSSLALMLALAIDTIEQIRGARGAHDASKLPAGVKAEELDKTDEDDVIGLWGVDMAAMDEYAYQRPGCQFFVLEAMRRGIGVYLPPESDLMRPQPVYGISEWDHNYIKLTSRARELSAAMQTKQAQLEEAKNSVVGIQGELSALNAFVSTWTSPYGMLPGMIIRQEPGTGLGSGITSFDGRPVSRMGMEAPPAVLQAMTEAPEAQAAKQLIGRLELESMNLGLVVRDPEQMLGYFLTQANDARTQAALLQQYAKPGESSTDTMRRLIAAAVQAKPKKAKRRR